MVEIKEKYDVLVVGAGPAGLEAAKTLAEQKINVLCLDRKQEIGAPKRCAEGLGVNWFERLGLKPQKEWAVWEIHGAALYSPSGKKVEIRMPGSNGYVLERKMFEKYLAREAALRGAKILTKAHVVDIKRNNGKIEAKYIHFDEEKHVVADLVIACDGVDSKIARILGLNTTNKLIDIDSGFQYEMAGIDYDDPDLINLFFGTEIAKRGYVWIFPKGKHEANVGIGIGGNAEKTAKYYLDKFVNAHPGLRNGSIIEVNCGCVPVGGFLDSMVADNLLVAGDAAHHVNPAHGGGIGIAMEAGRMAAQRAAEALKAHDYSAKFLDEYTKKWYETRGNDLKKVLKARNMLEVLNDSDFEVLVDSITADDVMKIAKGDISKERLALGVIVKNPKAAAVFMKYLAAKKD